MKQVFYAIYLTTIFAPFGLNASHGRQRGVIVDLSKPEFKIPLGCMHFRTVVFPVRPNKSLHTLDQRNIELVNGGNGTSEFDYRVPTFFLTAKINNIVCAAKFGIRCVAGPADAEVVLDYRLAVASHVGEYDIGIIHSFAGGNADANPSSSLNLQSHANIFTVRTIRYFVIVSFENPREKIFPRPNDAIRLSGLIEQC